MCKMRTFWCYEVGKHDKVWEVGVEVKKNGVAILERRWGSRTGPKAGVAQMMTETAAEKEMNRLVKQKTRAGRRNGTYVEVPETMKRMVETV